MARPKTQRSISSIEALTDDEVERQVLSSWHKLNGALVCGQSAGVIRRLLALELSRGDLARPNVAERLRQALQRTLSRQSKIALDRLLDASSTGAASGMFAADLLADLEHVGLDPINGKAVVDKLQERDA